MLEGHLSASHLDQYLRLFDEGQPGATLALLVLRFADGPHGGRQALTRVVREVYANLRGGDLIFVCDPQTLVCLIADGDAVSAGAAGERIVSASTLRLGRRLHSCVVSVPDHGATLASLLERAELDFDRALPARAAS